MPYTKQLYIYLYIFTQWNHYLQGDSEADLLVEEDDVGEEGKVEEQMGEGEYQDEGEMGGMDDLGNAGLGDDAGDNADAPIE